MKDFYLNSEGDNVMISEAASAAEDAWHYRLKNSSRNLIVNYFYEFQINPDLPELYLIVV